MEQETTPKGELGSKRIERKERNSPRESADKNPQQRRHGIGHFLVVADICFYFCFCIFIKTESLK